MIKAGSLTPDAFNRLLTQFDVDQDSAGVQYEQLRRKLLRFFDGRGCQFPDQYADEALDRIARKLEKGESFRELNSYAVGVARMLLKEAQKEGDTRTSRVRREPVSTISPVDHDTALSLDYLAHCLETLRVDEREMILEYYRADKSDKIVARQQMSQRLKLPLNALRIRTLRIRRQLELCVLSCRAKAPARSPF